MTRIALIHALNHSVAPINEAFARDWPEATRMNLLDDSLSADLAQRGTGLDAAMHARFMALADYAVGTGAEGILFTCSAFGTCIDAVAARYPQMPVLKPNEAMVAEAQGGSGPGCTRIALAQFSMARARAACAEATGLRVLTTVDSAVAALRRRLD